MNNLILASLRVQQLRVVRRPFCFIGPVLTSLELKSRFGDIFLEILDLDTCSVATCTGRLFDNYEYRVAIWNIIRAARASNHGAHFIYISFKYRTHLVLAMHYSIEHHERSSVNCNVVGSSCLRKSYFGHYSDIVFCLVRFQFLRFVANPAGRLYTLRLTDHLPRVPRTENPFFFMYYFRTSTET